MRITPTNLRPPLFEPILKLSVLSFLLVALLCPGATKLVRADDSWPSFRGDGSSIAYTSLPQHWSPEAGITWRMEIPGYGQSAPVIWKNSIYVTSSDGPFQEKCQIHAFSLDDGRKRWTREIAATTPVENYFRNSRAAPTCAVDADAVYSFFASGDVTAMTHAGEVLWSLPLFQRFGEVDNERGIASSLAQTDELLIVVIDHHGPSYIAAIRKSDGELAWKTERGKRLPSWSSPVLARHEDQAVVVISSADTVDAYDVKTGQTLWQLDGLKGNHIPSASVVGNRIYIGSTTMYGGEQDPDAVAGSNCCIELINEPGKPGYRVLWGAERANSYYSTPLAFAGYVYYVNKVGVLYCIQAETGAQVFAKRIGNPCWASALGVTDANGESLVYFVSRNGMTLILRPGDEYNLVARNQLWDTEEMTQAASDAQALRKSNKVPEAQAKPKTGPELVFAGMPERQLHEMFSYGDPTVYGIAAASGSLIIRTGQHLYCIRQADTRKQ